MISIRDCAAGLGLSINAKKTTNTLTGIHQHDTDVYINQNKIENVDMFIYLGSSIHHQGDMGLWTSCRISKASAAFNQLVKFWTNKKFSFRLKLNAFNSKCLHRILDIWWSDFIPNDWGQTAVQMASSDFHKL